METLSNLFPIQSWMVCVKQWHHYIAGNILLLFVFIQRKDAIIGIRPKGPKHPKQTSLNNYWYIRYSYFVALNSFNHTLSTTP